MNPEKYTKIHESERQTLLAVLNMAGLEGAKLAGLDFATQVNPILEKLKIPSEHPKLLLVSIGDDSDMTPARVSGFVLIKALGDAQQVKLSVELLNSMIALLKALPKLGFDELWVTVQSDRPIIIGGKGAGFAIAPRITNNEETT